jgi:hypothetical protein
MLRMSCYLCDVMVFYGFYATTVYSMIDASSGEQMYEHLLSLCFAKLMYHAHAVDELAYHRLAASKLKHAVRDRHHLTEDHIVHSNHRLLALFFVHIMPRHWIWHGL